MKFLSRPVWAWALWDQGTSAISSVVITFVFAAYLTSDLFPSNAEEIVGWVLSAVGILVALVAPVIGLSSDRSGYHASWLRASTGLLVIFTFCLFFVKPGQLMVGTVLLAIITLINEIAQVHYNAMLPNIAPKEDMSHVSAFGWGLGYLGSIFALAIVLFGFIMDSTRIYFIPSTEGMPVRASMLFVGVWVLVWCLPILLIARDKNVIAQIENVPFHRMYGELFDSIKTIWKANRFVILFVAASALFRDGLNGVFAFAGILAQGAFNFTPEEIIIFAIAANLLAGIVTTGSGWLDRKIGSLRVIRLSLIILIALGVCMFWFHEMGKPLFWALGLGMSCLVGPAQSSSRTYLAKIVPKGQEAEVFGLYATTGRAVSFMSPGFWALSLFIGRQLNDGQPALHWGILGICLVMVFGVLAMNIMERSFRKAGGTNIPA